MSETVEQLIARTNHVAANREKEFRREAQQDANAPESTVEGMVRVLEILLAGYRGYRK